MNWAEKQHPVETIIEWLAPIPLAVAAGWAGGKLGLSMVEIAAIGVALLTAGFAVMKRLGGAEMSQAYDFAPVAFEEVQSNGLGELLLEAKDELLELTDPLIEVAPDSRVVQLFARQDPTPGELVNRIADFLGEGSRPVPAMVSGPNQSNEPIDASAALHAALANIRASLR